jgi:deoxyadenosine/deoxycytidine kinase
MPVEPAGPVRPKLVLLEGNIGAGKSSILDWLQSHQGIEALGEPVELWRKFFEHNLLKLKYEGDVKHMEFLFQSIVNLSRVEQLSNAEGGKDIRLMERSIHSAFNTFVKVSYDNRAIMGLEFRTMYYMYKVFTEGELGKLSKPDLILYLKTAPEICMERIKQRGRVEERPITLKYLQQVHDAYELWLGGTPYRRPCPVVTLDGNINENSYPQLITRITEELDKLVGGKAKREKQWDLDRAIWRWREKKERGEVAVD